MPSAARTHKVATVKRLSTHYVGGVFYAYKSMIGGRRFYFGREYAISGDNARDAKRATEAAAIFRREWERLQAAGVDVWNDGAIENAKANARLVLLGAAVPQSERKTIVATATPTPTETPAPTSAPASVDVRPSTGPLTLYRAFDLFLLAEESEVAERAIRPRTLRDEVQDVKALKQMIADVPVADIRRAQIKAMVGAFKRRPDSAKGKPFAVNTVRDRVASLRKIFNWLRTTDDVNDQPYWAGYVDWRDDFKFDPDSLLTVAERRDVDKGIPHFTIDELSLLYANATPSTRLYILLGLNCAMGQTEIATLERADCRLSVDPAMIQRRRNKTLVLARWTLWGETANALKGRIADQATADAFGAVDWQRGPKYRRKVEKPTTTDEGSNVSDLALLTEDGYPVVHGFTDAVGQAWTRLMGNPNVKGTEKGKRLVRPLGFYTLRKTAAQMIKDIAGYETHKIFGAWSTVDPTGRQSVSEKHYTNRTDADFDKVAAALEVMRERLQPMFDSVPYATKGARAKASVPVGDASELIAV